MEYILKFKILLDTDHSMEIEETGCSRFEETAQKKGMSPQAQGNDAALEQLIKRSKKGAKIQVKYWTNSLKC